MRKEQLYTVLSTASDPSTDDPYRVALMHKASRLGVDEFPLVRWPNGKPCVPVNAYIMEYLRLGREPGTLKGYARELTHVIRYCAGLDIGFGKLTDNDIWTLSEHLQTEKKQHDPTASERNPNTVKSILRTTLGFLAWYQQAFLKYSEVVLVGELADSANITVTVEVNDQYFESSKQKHKPKEAISLPQFRPGVKGFYLNHLSFPTEVSVDPKQPISRMQIQMIEKKIDEKALKVINNESKQRQDSRTPELKIAKAEYLRARRLFTIWLMKRTGLRPEELIKTPVNQDVGKNGALEIPTAKRRKKEPPVRKFPMNLQDALRFKRYITSRASFIKTFKDRDSLYVEPSELLLTDDGVGIEKESIARDFRRLANEAGFEDVDACLKMFRIRFITQQVAAHLKEKMQKTGRNQQTFEAADYTAILKRIAELTGHKSEKSLWFYVYKGWEELEVWDTVDRNIERLRMV
ncbi:MAG: hypothetical protein ABW072_08605 [Sedimenticola sp.]